MVQEKVDNTETNTKTVAVAFMNLLELLLTAQTVVAEKITDLQLTILVEQELLHIFTKTKKDFWQVLKELELIMNPITE